MSLPFNNYDQLRCRGNEYVTDQTFNRVFYRFYRNDVYLDNTVTDHITNELIHNSGNIASDETHLSGDRMVILSCGGTSAETPAEYSGVFDDIMVTDHNDPKYGNYLKKGWQTLIDEQPRNLGGHTLIFRIQINDGLNTNPTALQLIRMDRILTLRGFYGGNLVLESPPAYAGESGVPPNTQHDSSAVNQRICLMGNELMPYTVSIERCKCRTIIRQCTICIDHISSTPLSVTDRPSNPTLDVIYQDNEDKSCMTKHDSNGEWTMLNIRRAINVEDCGDVLIRHCCIGY